MCIPWHSGTSAICYAHLMSAGTDRTGEARVGFLFSWILVLVAFEVLLTLGHRAAPSAAR